MDYLFSGLIKCIDCNASYRGKKQRERRVYICSGYSKQTSSCKRLAIQETDLIDVITKHFNSQVIDLEQIKVINVTNGNTPKITVEYADGTSSVLSPNHFRV